MSATILAAEIVGKWDELSRDSVTNRETWLKNRLMELQTETAIQTVRDLTEDIAKADL